MAETTKPEPRHFLVQLSRSGAAVVLRPSAALAIVAAITFICFRLIPVNATTVGFAYLVAILVIATAWGLLEATIASVLAMLCFNYFFLPPIGTFTIADPQNWVALFAFLVTAISASQLSARAKRRTTEALDRQREMERLYALSRAILLTDPDQSATKQIVHQIARAFDFRGVVLFDRSTSETLRAGPKDLPIDESKLRDIAVQGTVFRHSDAQTAIVPLSLGGKSLGSLAIQGSSVSGTARPKGHDRQGGRSGANPKAQGPVP